MTTPPRVLLFDAAPRATAELVGRLRGRGLPATPVPLEGAVGEVASAGDIAVVLLDSAAPPAAALRVRTLLERLVSENIVTVVWGARDELRPAGGPLVEWLNPETELAEVVGKLGSLARYAPLVRAMDRELQQLQRLGVQLNRYFGEIDQEMRLAGRLQRDFLPRDLAAPGPYTFAALYRPASWVSGDIYDVQRIDEHHIGVLVGDAMGHGVAAGLLTMFLRQALVTKRVSGQSYRIVPPAEVLGELHSCLVRQKLPNSQFVTAVYGVLDTRTGELCLARAGHPYPVLVRGAPGRLGAAEADSGAAAGPLLTEVRSGGGLLGLADVPLDFEETQVRLAPGDKLVLYTDGAEEVLVAPGADAEATEFTTQFHEWSRLPASELVETFREHIDARAGSLYPADDVTVLVLEAGNPQFGAGQAGKPQAAAKAAS